MIDYLKTTFILLAGVVISAAPFVPLRSDASPSFLAHRRGAFAGGGPSYLFDESFEGTGYENTWSEAGGDWDEDSTTQAIDGSQSCYSNSPSVNERTDANDAWSGVSTTYGFFAIYVDAIGATVTTFIGRDSAESTLFYLIFYNTAGRIRAYHGTAWSQTDSLFSIDEWTYVWFDYTAGGGTDGTLNVYVSNTTTKPVSADIAITTGTSTADAVGIRLQNTSNSTDIFFDKILIDDVDIGDNP